MSYTLWNFFKYHVRLSVCFLVFKLSVGKLKPYSPSSAYWVLYFILFIRLAHKHIFKPYLVIWGSLSLLLEARIVSLVTESSSDIMLWVAPWPGHSNPCLLCIYFFSGARNTDCLIHYIHLKTISVWYTSSKLPWSLLNCMPHRRCSMNNYNA